MADRDKTATVGRGGAAANRADNGAADSEVAAWPLDRLVDHIVQTHHRYVRGALPVLAEQLEALRFAHGDVHPELAPVALAFDAMRRELERHLLKEEQILFPYVRQLVERSARGDTDWVSPFGTVANPIAMMEREHREAFQALRQIRSLANEYVVPADCGAGYAACMAGLAEFEADLDRHVHLESTVLFPRTLALERSAIEGG